MRISDWSSDVCSSDLPACRDAGDRKSSLGAYRNRQARNAAFPAAAADEQQGHLYRQPRQSVPLACRAGRGAGRRDIRSEEHTSELQSLMRISYAVFCLTTKKHTTPIIRKTHVHNQAN